MCQFKLKKIKQSIGDIFDDIFDSIFIQGTQRQEIVHNFGKFLRNTCERIHLSNIPGVQPTILLKVDCFTYIFKDCTQIYSFCRTLQVDDFEVSRLIVKTSQLNLYLDMLALMLLYLLNYTILINILVLFYDILFHATFE